jgi:hypothetical protein
MLMRGIAVLVLVVTLCQGAEAGALHRVSCTVVRLYVAKYSEAAAETWARSFGATDVEIETAPVPRVKPANCQYSNVATDGLAVQMRPGHAVASACCGSTARHGQLRPFSS